MSSDIFSEVFLSIIISTLFFILTAAISSIFIFYTKPLLRLGKGPMSQPKSLNSAISSWLSAVVYTKYTKKRELVAAVINFAFGFLLLSLIPIQGELPTYFERPDILFVLFYLLNRVAFVAPLTKSAGKFKTELDKPLVASLILVFLFCILGLKKGGGAYISEMQLHLELFTSISSVIAFFILFSFSSLFFLPASESTSETSFNSACRYMSKAVWFSLLIWMFIGVFPASEGLNFAFYVIATAALIVLHDLSSSFFPRVSAHIKFEVLKRSLVPFLLLVLFFSWIEGRIVW